MTNPTAVVRRTRKAHNNLTLRNFLLTLNPDGLDVELWEDWKRNRYGIHIRQGGQDLLSITCTRPKHDREASEDEKIKDCVESYLNQETWEKPKMVLPSPEFYFEEPAPQLTWKLIPSEEEEDDFVLENQ